MKNGDTHEHYVKDYQPLNDFLIQRMGPAMEGFFNCYQFTQRESEILILIAVYGFSNREIAEQCVISEKTVKNHLANIMKKIGIRSTRKLLSLLFNHVLYSHENHSTKLISHHAFGQIYEEKGECHGVNTPEAIMYKCE
jgi:DNA-binding CsgD family transcriptional regulator